MKKFLSIFTAAAVILSLTGCSDNTESESSSADAAQTTEDSLQTADSSDTSDTAQSAGVVSDKEYIEQTLNLANNEEQEWSYSTDSDAWVLSIVQAVVYAEIPDQQGVSVCVPGAYVTGIDTNGDGEADVTSESYTEAVKGSLVIDYSATVTSTNGQVYTAATAPVILNTGAAGYSSSTNTLAATTYASEGYINVSCGNRGKQDTLTAEDGTVTYTGDAPSCLVDQKNATRFVKYNILLGNLPGSVDYFVSTGGSGGGAHATMFSATSNNPDFYDYEIEAGAVGVYLLDDGSYTTTVTIDGEDYDLSDGAWGTIAYSPITSLKEADMAMAFEYYLDADYDFGSDFQKQLAEYLSAEYMDYINSQELTVDEEAVGFDLNGDGTLSDTIALTIEYDPDAYPETNGYYGTYLDLYLAEFQSNLQWYLDNLDYSEGWTWFDEDGNALSDEETAAMTAEDKATAFIEGRYAKSGGGKGGMTGGMGRGNMLGGIADGELPDGEMLGGGMRDGMADGEIADTDTERSFDNAAVAENSAGDAMDVGTPDVGTTQAAGSSTDSKNYQTYAEMLEEYEADIAEIEAGDRYGNNIVDLYDPLQYIGDDETDDPTWVRMLMGAAEGDMSMFSSLNLQIAMLNAGIDANIEWQWDGGHVPSEIFSKSFSLYVDEMYAKYAGGVEIAQPEATPQTENGTETEANGTDISAWVSYDDISSVSFSLADIAAYRTSGASKAIPGFDVIDYGQEDYVFGSSTKDARHWNSYLLEILKENQETLEPLFNSGNP